jgi:hypothetical protein
LESSRAIERLETLIADAIPALEARLERPLEYREPRSPITEGEAAGFFRAIDGGFFEVEVDALCIPRLMRPSTGFSYPLLSPLTKHSSTIVIWREWLTHASLPATLHFDLGYPTHDIALDVDAFDALAFSKDNQPWIVVEAKKTIAELEKTVREMTALVEQPFRLRRAPPRLSNSEQKARGLLALRPRFFLVIAPGQSSAFSVSYPPDPNAATATLQPIEIDALRAAS